MTRRILIVEDDPAQAAMYETWLRPGAEVFTAGDALEGVRVLLAEIPDIALVDVFMPGGGGLHFVEEARRYLPGCAVVGMSGEAGPSELVGLLRKGMADFLPKPFAREELNRAMQRAVRVRSLKEAIARMDGLPAAADDDPFAALLGESPAWKQSAAQLRSAARTDSAVLIVGPTGSGKAVAARCLHAASSRRDGPFVVVSCAALPESLLEVELFGHAAGSFTGAASVRLGRFEAARGGTLVLVSADAIPVAAQARLLRVLESGCVQRIGESAERPVDARIVATAERDPHDDARSGRMREDLAHRLDRLRVQLPPLAERGDDLLLLAAHLLGRQAHREQRKPRTLSSAAIGLLRAHDWPGNVRELANVLERAGIESAGSDVIDAGHLRLGRLGDARLDPADWPLPEEGIDLPALLAGLERDLVDQAMRRADGHHARAASLLRIGRSSLERKLARSRPADVAKADPASRERD